MKKILLSIFLSTIFMANVVAMAGTCDDYNIETRNDNGVEVYSVLENDECNRDEAMAEILRLTGDPSYTQQPSLFRASDPLYKNNQGYHGTTTAYGWKRLYNYDDYFNYTGEFLNRFHLSGIQFCFFRLSEHSNIQQDFLQAVQVCQYIDIRFGRYRLKVG